VGKIFENEAEDEELLSAIESYKNRAKTFKNVCVIMGGESEEREISLKTGEAVFSALVKSGFKVEKIVFPPSDINSLKNFDAAFICLHGRYGEDGTVQGLLEILKIPYTSPDPVVSALFMDKFMTRLVLKEFVPQPRFFMARSEDEAMNIIDENKINIPFVVKPNFSGSSLGISIVKEKNEKKIREAIREAFKFSSSILIEEFLDGPEFTVGVFEKMPISALEIVPKEDEFFSFEAKYKGNTDYIIPPRSIDREAIEEALKISRVICEKFDVRGAVRLDFKMKKNDEGRKSKEPYFLELNTIPGMTERSLLPKLAAFRGINFEDFVSAILGTASLKISKR
jgi:D-alanine-D-alanine ligase